MDQLSLYLPPVLYESYLRQLGDAFDGTDKFRDPRDIVAKVIRIGIARPPVALPPNYQFSQKMRPMQKFDIFAFVNLHPDFGEVV